MLKWRIRDISTRRKEKKKKKTLARLIAFVIIVALERQRILLEKSGFRFSMELLRDTFLKLKTVASLQQVTFR